MNALDLVKRKDLDNMKSDDLAELTSSSFIPSLNICYATSKAFESGLAQPGEIILGGDVNLGNKNEFIVLSHRRHAAFISSDFSIHSEVFHFPTSGDVKNNKEYQEFIKSPVPEGCKDRKPLEDGADFLMYIPSQKAFGLLFCKGVLTKQSAKINDAGYGGRLISLQTEKKEWAEKKLKWYEFIIRKEDRAVKGTDFPDTVVKDIEIPMDLLEKVWELWNNPVKGVETVKDGETKARAR